MVIRQQEQASISPRQEKGGPLPGKTVGNNDNHNHNGNGSGLEDIRLLDGAVAARLSSSVDTAQDSITQPPLPAPVRRSRKIDNQRLPRRNNDLLPRQSSQTAAPCVTYVMAHPPCRRARSWQVAAPRSPFAPQPCARYA